MSNNPFWELPREELAKLCMEYAGKIQKRPRHTRTGDEIYYLLIAASWALHPPNAGMHDPTKNPFAPP